MPRHFFPAITVDEKEGIYTKPVLIAILVLAAILRLTFLFELQRNPMPAMVAHDKVFDQYNYLTMAQDLMRHNWLGSEHPGHSPVYSYLIAALFSIFGNDMNIVFVFQIFYGVLGVYLFYRCTVLLFRNQNLGLWTAFVAALYSPFIYYECALLRESVIGYTNLVAFYFFLLALRKGKNKNYFFAGMASALSLILRAGLLPVFVLGYVLFLGRNFKKNFTHFLFVIAGMMLVIAPLTIRNYICGFKAVTETSGPTLFWLGNSFDSPGIGLTYTPTQEKLTSETQGRILPTLKVLWREVIQHPSEYKSLVGRKFKMLFNGFEIPANLSYDLFKEQSVVLKLAVFNFVLICPLALLGLLLVYRKYEHVGILYVFIFALTFFVFIFHIQSRYRVAFLPFYVIAASYSVFWFWERIRKRNYYPAAIAGAVFLPLFVFTFPDHNIMERYFDGGIRAIDYANMAGSYLMRVENQKLAAQDRRENLEKAIAYYDKALPHLNKQGQESVYITQAFVYRDLHMKVHQLDALNKALQINPQNPIAQKEYRLLTGHRL